MSIFRRSRSPLYAQIRQELEQDILSKKLKPGDKLPSEKDLAFRFGVSRMTARRAIDQLVSQGWLKRVQGKGTYVIEPPSPSQPVGITRWSFERVEAGQEMQRTVWEIKELTPSMRVANALRTIPGEKIIQISGLLSVDDSPAGYYVERVPKLLVPSITAWHLDDLSLAEFLSQQCNLEFSKVTERIRAVPSDEEAMAILEIESNRPLLEVDDLIFLKSGIPAILSNTIYRCDRYTYKGLLHPL